MILFGRIYFLLFAFMIAMLILMSIPSNLKMGLVYFNSYEYDKAYELLAKVRKADTENLGALKKLRDYFLIHGETKKALGLQLTLTRVKPKNKEFLKDLEKLYDWNLLPYEKLKVQEKRAFLEESTESRNKLLLSVASGFRWLKKNKDANRVFKILEEEPDVNTGQVLVDYYLATKQANKAISIIEKSIAETPSHSQRKVLADSYLSIGKRQKAIENYYVLIFNKNLKIEEAKWSDLGIQEFKDKKDEIEKVLDILTFTKQYKETLRINLRRYELFEEKASVRFSLAANYQKLGIKDKALEILPTLEGVRTSREFYLYETAMMYRNYKKNKDAIRVFEALIKYRKKSPVYLKEYAEFLEEIGSKERALQIYLRLLKLRKKSTKTKMQGRFIASEESSTPNKAEAGVMAKIIDLMQDLGKEEGAIPYLESLIKRDPSNPGLHKRLGYFHYKNKNKEMAFDSFLKAYELGGRKDDLIEILSSMEFERKNFNKSFNYLSVIYNKKKSISYIRSMYGELLFNLEKKEEYTTFCNELFQHQLEESVKDIELSQQRINCHLRNGKPLDSLALLEKMKFYHDDKGQISTQIAYISLDVVELDKAKEVLLELKERGLWTEEHRALWNRLDEELLEKEKRNSIYLVGNIDYWNSSRHKFLDKSIGLKKRLEKFEVGAKLHHLGTYGDAEKSWINSSFWGGYHFQFAAVRLGLSPVISGDKSLTYPLYLEANTWFVKNLFTGIQIDNGDASKVTPDLASDKKSFRGRYLIFAEYNKIEDFGIYGSLTHQNIKSSSGSGSSKEVFLDYWKNVFTYHGFGIYPGARLNYQQLNSNSTFLRSNYLNKALITSLSLRVMKRNYGGLIHIGMDHRRDLSFTKVRGFQLWWIKRRKKEERIRVDFEYFEESIQNILGNTFLLSLKWNLPIKDWNKI